MAVRALRRPKGRGQARGVYAASACEVAAGAERQGALDRLGAWWGKGCVGRSGVEAAFRRLKAAVPPSLRHLFSGLAAGAPLSESLS